MKLPIHDFENTKVDSVDLCFALIKNAFRKHCLSEQAAPLQIKQVKAYGEQFAATDALNLAKASANKVFMTHVKIARIALKGARGLG
jgi:hypothetical protein